MSIEFAQEMLHYVPPEGTLSLWWHHQAGYVYKLGGKTAAVDLFLSDIPQRLAPPLVTAEELQGIDYFLGSHDHGDHIDRAVWPTLARSNPKAKFLVPARHAGVLRRELDISPERIIGIGNETPFEEDGFRVTAVPAAHELLDPDPLTGEYDAIGFIIECGGFRIYHSGDCCIYEGLQTRLKAAGPLDAMFLPIQGRDAVRLAANIIGNMTYQEAADLAGAVEPKLVIPMHYDCFSGNTEDPFLFFDYMRVKYPGIPSVVLQAGRRFDIRKQL